MMMNKRKVKGVVMLWKLGRTLCYVLLFWMTMAATLPAHAAGNVIINPMSHNFRNVTVGLKTSAFDFQEIGRAHV